MSAIHLPAWTLGNKILTGVQTLMLAQGAGEAQGQNAGYSKFADKTAKFKVPSRVGMTWIYTPGLLTSAWFLHNAVEKNGRETLTAALLTAHFGKRVLECLFLHRYSGTVNGDAFIPISFFYGLMAALVAYQQKQVSGYGKGEAWLLKLGLVLNVVGQVGNFYHHWLLASLRSRKTQVDSAALVVKSPYVIPTGGFFSLLTCPHYFFEIIAWFGIASVTGQLNAFLVAGDMASYLAGRSMSTTRWYKEKFPDYPSNRRHLIPFLF